MTVIPDKNKTNLMADFQLQTRLSLLMQEQNLSEAELSRRTGIPTTTLNRILSQEAPNPRADTLAPLAKYFSVTIGQLLGLEPIGTARQKGEFQSSNKEAWSQIPIIEWEDSVGWAFKAKDKGLYTFDQWITTEKSLSEHAFALISKRFMEPKFRNHSTLIVEPEKLPADGDYVLYMDQKNKLSVRQFIEDGDHSMLRPFNQGLGDIQYNKKHHKLIGVIVESRISHN